MSFVTSRNDSKKIQSMPSIAERIRSQLVPTTSDRNIYNSLLRRLKELSVNAPKILRKIVAQEDPAHYKKIQDSTKQVQRPEHRSQFRLLCDEETTYNNRNRQAGGTASLIDPELTNKSRLSTQFKPTLRHNRSMLSLILIIFASFLVPVAALDNQIVLGTYPAPTSHGIVGPDVHPVLPVGIMGTFILITASCASAMAKRLLAPLMGVSSVLWFIMRNDAAIKPGLSWTVFGTWSVLTLMYLSYQSRRVAHDGIYILLVIAFASFCLCIVALVQKASIPGGLVTAIPPCTSLAAYAVAFCFPKRRGTVQEFVV